MRVLFVSLLLSGCTWNIQEKAMDLSTQGLEEAETYVCTTARVGAVRSRYAGRMDIYNDFCTQGEL